MNRLLLFRPRIPIMKLSNILGMCRGTDRPISHAASSNRISAGSKAAMPLDRSQTPYEESTILSRRYYEYLRKPGSFDETSRLEVSVSDGHTGPDDCSERGASLRPGDDYH